MNNPFFEQAALWVQQHLEPLKLAPITKAAILGSGHGALVSQWPFPVVAQFAYSQLPGAPVSNVQGHSGTLFILQVQQSHCVAVFSGRTHAYETTDLDAVVFNVRLAASLGAKTLVLTNAAGGLDAHLNPGQLMLITDHINLTGLNPLRGRNPVNAKGEPLGSRFFDMSEAYSATLRQQALALAEQNGIVLHQGVYAWMLGPAYETPAEIRMLATLGANAVGMSTVPEVIASKHLGLKVVAISCITNKAAGLQQGHTLNHEEVLAMAKQAEAPLSQLLEGLLR